MQALLSPLSLRRGIEYHWHQFLKEVRSKRFLVSLGIWTTETILAGIVATAFVLYTARDVIYLIWHRHLF